MIANKIRLETTDNKFVKDAVWRNIGSFPTIAEAEIIAWQHERMIRERMPKGYFPIGLDYRCVEVDES